MNMPMGVLIANIAVGTFGLRLSFIHLYGKMDLPPSFERAMKYVPPSALAALVMPAVLYPDGQLNATLGNHRLLAGLVAGFVAYRTENFLATVVSGMVSLWIFRFIM